MRLTAQTILRTEHFIPVRFHYLDFQNYLFIVHIRAARLLHTILQQKTLTRFQNLLPEKCHYLDEGGEDSVVLHMCLVFGFNF